MTAVRPRPSFESFALLACAAALPGCSEPIPSGAPTIRVGHDACIECGMMIAEDRCSAASIVEHDGIVEERLFDDIGCLLDWERGHPEESVRSRWVHDYATRTWCDALVAGYIDHSTVRTPMASGLLAFADGRSAVEATALHGGRPLDWAALAAARLAWLDERDRAYEREAERELAAEPPPAGR